MPKRFFPNRRNGIFFFQLRFLNCDSKKTFQITFHGGITLFLSFLHACLLIIILSETVRTFWNPKYFTYNPENVCSWNAESGGKFLLVESGVQLKEYRILLKIEIHNPCSNEKDRNQEYTTCNLESKTVLDSLIWGEIEAYMYVLFQYSGKNQMRFAVFWRISVRFCGFRTPLTPPSLSVTSSLLSPFPGCLSSRHKRGSVNAPMEMRWGVGNFETKALEAVIYKITRSL